MNSRSCRWLIVSALVITASCVWAQRSAPPAPDQKEQTVKLCSEPPALDEKSIVAFKQQAASGDAAAQCGMGTIYYVGQGVPQDYTQAAGWFRKAADQGDAHAQYDLGVLYDNGQGVPQDYAQAVTWYRKAADQGNAEAQFALGLVYDTGRGVAKDSAEAARWLRKAADQGLADAQFGLGVAYFLGNGVPRDYSEAYFWLDLAAMGKPGYFKQEKLAKDRDEVASLLSNTALLQAQERARKWFEAHQAKPQ